MTMSGISEAPTQHGSRILFELDTLPSDPYTWSVPKVTRYQMPDAV